MYTGHRQGHIFTQKSPVSADLTHLHRINNTCVTKTELLFAL